MTFILFCFFVFLVPSAFASVDVVESLDDQLPAVARVNQLYSWTFSSGTFCSEDGPLNYSSSALPAWLTFDPDQRTFRGTPNANDTGYPDITVTAHGTGSSVSSRFSLCVTDAPPPTLNLPLGQQFAPNSSSLSSIFFLQAGSAIGTPDPTVRVPRKWSFSVGLESDTYVLPDGRDVFYELRLANGSSIPDYLTFNSKTVTLDGVVPPPDQVAQPLTLAFNLHASDQEGYTAATLPFTVVLADHELSAVRDAMPTINITTADEFLVSLLSPADFTGILVDGENIQPSNISSLLVDVSAYDWLHYDAPSRTLSGTPGNITDPNPVLPVNLTTIFNQTMQTHVSLAMVESFFADPVLPALNISKGDDVNFTLKDWFSPTSNPGSNESTVTATYSPITAANFMRYDADSTKLTGSIPIKYTSPVDHITVTFTAYSHVTHSTSHTSMDIYVPGTGNNQSFSPSYPSGLATEAHRRLVLGLVLTFGIIGGLCLLTGIFAIVRRCSRVPDTAVLGEEGRIAWSEKDRRWYGLTLSPRGTRVIERVDKVFDPDGPADADKTMDGLPMPSPLGLGLRRVSERSQQEGADAQHPHHTQYNLEAGGVMSKKEFLARIKETVRQVSDKYSVRRQRVQPRPAAQMVIGKPILVATTRITETGAAAMGGSGGASPSNLGDDSMLPPSRPASTFLTGSPSGSTGEHSIPRRRADFAPPKHAAQVHFGDGLLVRQASTTSMGGTSLQSGLSGEGESVMDMSMGPHTKPRLVPFTNSTRVPVPMPQVVPMGVPAPQGGGFAGNRITSQRAKVCKVDSQDAGALVELGAPTVKRSSTGDELSMGMHYVRALGVDQLTVKRTAGAAANGSSPAMSNLRSSFTSLESSGRSGAESDGTMKVLLRAGERFKFRVPVPARTGAAKAKGYYVKLTSGQVLPKFVQLDLSGIAAKGVLELSGVPTPRDIGEMTVGIYAEHDGTCAASVIIEVVGKR